MENPRQEKVAIVAEVKDRLEGSQAGVLNWSRAARDSEWVRDEYEAMHGLSRRKPDFQFVPISLDDTPLPLFAGDRLFLDDPAPLQRAQGGT